jgi:hypothetical protein
MKNLCVLMMALVFIGSVKAQDKTMREIQSQTDRMFEDDTTHKSGWRKGAVLTFNVGQGGSRNWAAGAERFTFTIATYVSLYANLRTEKVTWRNTLDLGYALVNTTSQGVRKNDDKIDLYSKFGFNLSKSLSVGMVANFRSQFYKGFDYDYLGKGFHRMTSNFMAPAYLTLAPGIDWHPGNYFSLFVSPIAARFTFVTNHENDFFFPNGVIPPDAQVPGGGEFELPLAALYGVNPAQKVRGNFGAFASAIFRKEIIKNVALRSRLDLYSNYLRTLRFKAVGPNQLEITEDGAKPQNVDVFWTTLIALKVNNWLTVTYNFDLIYDDDVRQFGPTQTSPATQYRSLLAVGITAKI